MKIRLATPDDAPAVVALRATVYPYLVRGVESTRRMIASPPPGEQWAAFVAEIDDRLIGWASSYLNTTTSETAYGEIAMLHVHPEHRRQGTGGALLAACLDRLTGIGARRVRTFAQPESLDFARKRGFEVTREIRFSSLDPRLAPPPPPTPSGIRLRPLSELDSHVMYAAHAVAAADEPGDVAADAISYDTWRSEVWENLGLDREASTAALVGPTVVAFTLVKRDGERMWSDMTATLREHRGRGLARLVKSVALRRAAERGVTVAYTSNDEANAPMLAINARLGYRPVASHWACLRTLT